MRLSKLTFGLLAAALASPVSGQTVAQDVRCLVLSDIFTKAAIQPRAKESAEKSVIFYLGRIDGRADQRTLANALRAQRATINPQTAGSEMGACATRLVRASQAMEAINRSSQPAK